MSVPCKGLEKNEFNSQWAGNNWYFPITTRRQCDGQQLWLTFEWYSRFFSSCSRAELTAISGMSGG